jgi:excisionase family DNA binding protein
MRAAFFVSRGEKIMSAVGYLEREPARAAERREPEQLLDAADVGRVLKISLPNVRRLLASGEIESILVGRRWRVRPEALDSFIEKRTRHVGG